MDDTNETKFFTNVTLNGETLAVKDKNALTEHQDLSAYAKTADVNNGLAKKQDTIADLDTIRAGAAAGATAMQKLPDDVAKKADIPDTSNFVTSQDVTNQLNGIFGGLKITPWAEIDTTTAE